MELPGSNTAVLIRTYPELARELAAMVSSAKSEIYLASRYYEPAIGSRLLSKFAEEIAVHILDGNSSGISFEERIRVASNYDSKNKSLMLKMLDTSNVITSLERLEYSFIVVDGKHCGVELINPASPDDFYCALKLESTELAKGVDRNVRKSCRIKISKKN